MNGAELGLTGLLWPPASEKGVSGGSEAKNRPQMQELQETQVRSLGQEDPLEEGMATHSGILAWRIPMDGGAWWATVHGVTKSWTQLKRLSMHAREKGGQKLPWKVMECPPLVAMLYTFVFT